MKTPSRPALSLLLLSALALASAAAEPRKEFDLYLEHQGLERADYDGLPEARKEKLLGDYLETLREEGRRDEDAVSLLKRLRNPDLLKSYMEGSKASRPFLDASAPSAPQAGDATAAPGPSAAPDRAAQGTSEAARAAGLDVLESLRPGASAPAAPGAPPSGSKKDAAARRFPRGEAASLSELASGAWGSELLAGLTRDPLASDIETLDGALLRVEYADLGPIKQRGDTRIVEERGYYRVALDSRVRGTEAESCLQAHELSHVRDQMDYPQARPESFGLLMEHRANLYEVAVYLERHPDLGRMKAPQDFYDAEVWFKARLYAGDFGKSILEEIPESGRIGQMRAKAKRILAGCAAPCGGAEALYAWVVDPSYARSREGSILNLERESLEPELQLLWDDAEDYDAETAALDRRIREAYGLEDK